jgi:hypothetical protein
MVSLRLLAFVIAAAGWSTAWARGAKHLAISDCENTPARDDEPACHACVGAPDGQVDNTRAFLHKRFAEALKWRRSMDNGSTVNK